MNKYLKNDINLIEAIQQRDELFGLLTNIEQILETTGTITSKSIIRSSILIALGEDPKEKMTKKDS
jgi:hypothetical protein